MDSKNNSAIAVTYEHKTVERGRDFRWALFPEITKTNVKLDQGLFEFNFVLPDRGTTNEEWASRCSEYISDMELGLPMGLRTTLATQVLTQAQPRIVGPGFETFATLGRGKYGIVRLVKNVSTGAIYACKFFHQVLRGAESYDIACKREISMLKNYCNHEKIIQYRHNSCLDGFHHLIMPLMEGGTVAEQQKTKAYTYWETSAILQQCLEGLKYLHGNDIVHRNINPHNILVDSGNRARVKIGGFSLAKHGQSFSTPPEGSVRYRAPEQWDGPDDAKNRPVVDVWALGLVISDLAGFSPETPTIINGPEYCQLIVDTMLAWQRSPKLVDGAWEEHIADPDNYTVLELVYDCLLYMLERNPGERYSTTEMFQRTRLMEIFSKWPENVLELQNDVWAIQAGDLDS
ncbi:uncharacterized protein KY384_003861 [Bacidia gigantensis]|uniref:uncharacterized protein n=1 Tax=Bacidia gigantensis TaxID=2732470 RepID=UPI001D04EF4D|nr:uncharacterized protein KY384_003861 [Bacidia gigantensis]KAG8532220.1 hypothetical protein KY384_003861 [Bacidia gigantensis]